jgi:hypothetical protein
VITAAATVGCTKQLQPRGVHNNNSSRNSRVYRAIKAAMTAEIIVAIAASATAESTEK